MELMDAEASELLSEAGTWRNDAVAALSNKGIRRAIGRQKASRLRKTAESAQLVAVNDDGSLTSPIRRGLNIISLSENQNTDTRVVVEGQYRTYDFRIGEAMQPRVDGLLSHHPSAGISILALRASAQRVHIPEDRTAVLIHELTHAEQAKTTHVLPDPDDLAYQATIEAEAYETQFRVTNHFLDGRLMPLVQRFTGTDEFVDMFTAADWLAEDLTPNWTVQFATKAAVINRTFGYKPNGRNTPPSSLTEAYQIAGMIEQTPQQIAV